MVGELALLARGGGAVPEIVAQVGLQKPGIAPGLDGDHPAGQQVVGSNFVRDAITNPAMAQAIVNWPETAWAGLDRLRESARHAPLDQDLRSLISLAEAALASTPRPAAADAGLMVCPWFRVGDTVVRTIAMTAGFDHAADVTLDELRVELMYPLDEDAERYFRGQAHRRAR